MQADIKVRRLGQEGHGRADVVAGNGHQAGGGDGAVQVGRDDAFAGLQADSKIVSGDDECEWIGGSRRGVGGNWEGWHGMETLGLWRQQPTLAIPRFIGFRSWSNRNRFKC